MINKKNQVSCVDVTVQEQEDSAHTADNDFSEKSEKEKIYLSSQIKAKREYHPQNQLEDFTPDAQLDPEQTLCGTNARFWVRKIDDVTTGKTVENGEASKVLLVKINGEYHQVDKVDLPKIPALRIDGNYYMVEQSKGLELTSFQELYNMLLAQGSQTDDKSSATGGSND